MKKLKMATDYLKELKKGYHGPSMASQGYDTAIGAGPSMMAMSQTKELQKRLLDGWKPSQYKKD